MCNFFLFTGRIIGTEEVVVSWAPFPQTPDFLGGGGIKSKKIWQPDKSYAKY
jgi:hypothetical protein